MILDNHHCLDYNLICARDLSVIPLINHNYCLWGLLKPLLKVVSKS